MTSIDRRRFLTLGGATLAGTALFTATPALAQAEPAGTSVNGWPVLGAGQAQEFRIEGSGLTVWLAPAAAPVLLHIARRFLYEIEYDVQPGEITGHTTGQHVGAPYESTYLSGSGITIRPLHYPLGAKDGFFEHEKTVIRDILADCEQVVAWGGDLDPVKESHFHITEPPTSRRYLNLVGKLHGWDNSPGKGAGVMMAVS
jgi:hypothetical protein